MISLDAFNSIKAGAETNTRIFTPQKIVKEMIEALPPEVWNSKTTFLDPAVKSGVYLVEIFDKLMEVLADDENFKDESVRRKHILENQLFGIAIDEFDNLVAQRNLYGFIGGDSNIRYIEKYMDLVKNKDSRFYVDAVKKEFGEMKKFGVIIGNPPYQEMDGGNAASAKPIYHCFVEKANNIGNVISMIVPSRWFAGGKGLDDFRKMMLANRKITEIHDYQDASKVFENVNVAGGVNYFIINKFYTGECKVYNHNDAVTNVMQRPLGINGIVIRDNVAFNIARKIWDTKASVELSQIVHSRNAFDIQSSNTGMIKQDEQYCIKCYGNDGITYVTKDWFFDKEKLFDLYKVIVTRGIGGKGFVLTKNTEVLNPKEVCTETFICIGGFKTRGEADNLRSYLLCKFTRFLLLQALTSIAISKDKFCLIPLQDFTNQSDIDWSQSIADIDKQLYKKYNLTDEEIAYIEATIKPM